MAQLFNTYLYNPILQALIFIYDKIAFHDLGFAIILLTIAVRIVLFPLFYKGAKDQTIMQRLQPDIRRIQKELKTNKEEQARALFALYKKNKINPLSGFLLLLLQLPIIFALYQVFLKGLGDAIFDNKTFLGLIDLGAKSIVLALLAAFFQYIQGKLTLDTKKEASGAPGEDAMRQAGRMMMYVGPFLTLMILVYLPGAVGVYWATSTLISIVQQMYIVRTLNKNDGSR